MNAIEKAEQVTGRLYKWLSRRGWYIDTDSQFKIAMKQIATLQIDTIDAELGRLERMRQEGNRWAHNGMTAYPSISKTEQRKAQTELAQITEVINRLRVMRLMLYLEV